MFYVVLVFLGMSIGFYLGKFVTMHTALSNRSTKELEVLNETIELELAYRNIAAGE